MNVLNELLVRRPLASDLEVALDDADVEVLEEEVGLEVHEDDRPTLPATYLPLAFDTASEAFFVVRPEEIETDEWPVDEESEEREYWAERRRRSYGTWVAVVFAGSLTLLAAAWLPLISG